MLISYTHACVQHTHSRIHTHTLINTPTNIPFLLSYLTAYPVKDVVMFNFHLLVLVRQNI